MSLVRRVGECVVITAILAILYAYGQHIPLHASHLVVFFCGLFTPALLKFIIVRRLFRTSANGRQNNPDNSVYGLEHGRLNLKLPNTMWMNMGYWKSEYAPGDSSDTHCESPNSLSVACTRLLQEVFKSAGLSNDRNSSDEPHRKAPSRALLDLGIGCGDQTLCIMGPRDQYLALWDKRFNVPLFNRYIGITLDKNQYHYAQHRIQDRAKRNIELFCADGAKPQEWKLKLKQSIKTMVDQADETWVLALDTLYHFSPSRWPLISFASKTLQASLMAFDLCLADNISLSNLLLLRIVTKLMGAPWANFVTQDQYRVKLIEAGYEDIVLRDISDDVFGPLATFLEEQDKRLRVIGYGLGKFQAALWMFRWWARTGIIRGVIVIARKSD